MKKVAKTTHSNGLSLRWVPVSTEDGRVRMEMRWTAPQVLARRTA
jgi:hypothetical protein